MRYMMISLLLVVMMIAVQAQESVNYRGLRYPSGTTEEIMQWQEGTRSALFAMMHMSDLVNAKEPIPFDTEVISSEKMEGYTLKELRLNSTQVSGKTCRTATWWQA